MNESIKKLLELVSANPELQQKLKNATKKSLISLAKEVGITLTDADFEAPAGEIGDDELDAVAGGDKCYCFAGGGASRCTCVGAGYGYDIYSKA